MPRNRSKFVNRLALRKTLRNFDGNALKGIYVPPYVKMLDEVHKEARRNAPVNKDPKKGQGRGGKLRGNIRKYIRTKKAARAGKGGKANRIGRFIVHSKSIQDRIIDQGIPKGVKLSGNALTVRRRFWKGRRHIPAPAGDFSKGGGKARAARYNGKDWAFGARKRNEYLNKGKNDPQALIRRNKKTAEQVGAGIMKWIAKEFSRHAER